MLMKYKILKHWVLLTKLNIQNIICRLFEKKIGNHELEIINFFIFIIYYYNFFIIILYFFYLNPIIEVINDNKW